MPESPPFLEQDPPFSLLGVRPGRLMGLAANVVIRLAAISCQLLYLKIYTAHLSKESIGTFAFFSSASYVVNALIFVPLDYFQQARINQQRRNNLSPHVWLTWNIRLLSWFSLAAILTDLVGGHLFDTTHVVAICAVLAVTLYSSTSLRNLLNNSGWRKSAAISTLVEALLKVGCTLLALQMLGASASSLLIAVVTSLTLSSAMSLAILWRCRFWSGKPQESAVSPQEIIRFSSPLAASALINLLQTQGYALLWCPQGFAADVGVVSVVTGIGASAMTALGGVYYGMFAAELYATRGSFLAVFIRNALVITALSLLSCVILSPMLVGLLAGEGYRSYAQLAVFGVASSACNLIIGAIGTCLTIRGSTREILDASLVGLGALVLTTIPVFLWKLANPWSIAMPMALSQMASCAYLCIITRHIRPTPAAPTPAA